MGEDRRRNALNSPKNAPGPHNEFDKLYVDGADKSMLLLSSPCPCTNLCLGSGGSCRT
jgi:hypothetical protein